MSWHLDIQGHCAACGAEVLTGQPVFARKPSFPRTTADGLNSEVFGITHAYVGATKKAFNFPENAPYAPWIGFGGLEICLNASCKSTISVAPRQAATVHTGCRRLVI